MSSIYLIQCHGVSSILAGGITLRSFPEESGERDTLRKPSQILSQGSSALGRNGRDIEVVRVPVSIMT